MSDRTKFYYLNQAQGEAFSNNNNENLDSEESRNIQTDINYLQVPLPSMLTLPLKNLKGQTSFKGVQDSQNSFVSDENYDKQAELTNMAIQSTNIQIKSKQIQNDDTQTPQKIKKSPYNFKMGTGIIGRAFMIDYLKLLLNFSKKIKASSQLSQEEIPQLELKSMVDYQHQRLSLMYYQKLENCIHENKPFTESDFLVCLFKLKIKSFIKMGFFLLFFYSSKIAASVCLQFLLQAITENQVQSYIYMWVSIICILLLLVNIFDQSYLRVLAVEQKIIVNVIMKHVHTKVYSFSAFTISQNNIGQLMNIVTNDLKVIEKKISETLKLPILPFPLIAAGVISYWRFGALSLVGLAFLIICVPIQALIGRISKYYFSQRAKVNDKRMQITHEVLESIRLIKLYSWEEAFMRMLNVIRSKDLRLLLINQIISIIENSISLTSGILSSFLIFFFVYRFEGPESLTLANMFSTLDIFQFLRLDIISSSGVGIAGIFELKVVMKRIVDILSIESQQMLCLNKINEGDLSRQSSEIQFKTVGEIKLTNFSAFWKYDSPVLKDFNCSISAGQLVTVIGPVSSGKSSFLNCFIKEIPFYSGEISFLGKVAYVEQEPIIFNMSLKDNILFGKSYNSELYKKVIQVSNLKNDIEILGGDDTIEIGEKGNNLSGGQKARLALARALYQEADIYLLDDTLSALDYNVIKEIFQNAIKEFLRGKTILLATHNFEIVQQSDYVLVIECGQIVKQGNPKDIKDFIETLQKKTENQHQNKSFKSNTIFSKDSQIERKKDSDIVDLIKVKSQRNIKRVVSQNKLESAHSLKSKTLLYQFNSLSIRNTDKQEQGSFVLSSLKKNESDLKKQQVSLSTYKTYFSYSTFKLLLFICILLYMSNEVIYIFFTKTLGNFTENNKEEYSDLIFDLGMFTLGYFTVMLLKKVLLNIFLRNNNYLLHKSMIQSILSSKISYFDKTPIGVIVNRFSSDLSNYLIFYFLILLILLNGNLDIDLFKSLSDSLEVVCNTLTLIITLILLNSYFIIIACISSIVLYLFFSNSKDVLIATKQLELNQKSKVFSFFNTSVQGILPIRVFNQLNEFKLQFNHITNNSLRSEYSYWFTNRGFGMYIIYIAQVASIIGIFMAIFINTSSSNLGQTITFFISLGSRLQTGLRQLIQLDATMSSAQRAINITQLEQESAKRTNYDSQFQQIETVNSREQIHKIQGSYLFPKEGKIEFKNVHMSYSKYGSNVLKGVSFSIQPGQRVAFVGRTGAGKSSILQALFRMFEIQKSPATLQSQELLTMNPKSSYNIIVTEPIQITEENIHTENMPNLEIQNNFESFIHIDGHDISDLGIKTLREGFSIIPQIPFIFTGTLKMNLDPYYKHSDEEIWQVIRDIKLENKIRELSGQLDTEISNSSDSFSTGQKQLICLGRALLKKSKILVLDEVTSSCDIKTEELILELLKTKFIGSTVIAIAHRLTTIADYDQIIVMKQGKIEEQGTSQQLLKLKSGIFTKMVKSSGKNFQQLIEQDQQKENQMIKINELNEIQTAII